MTMGDTVRMEHRPFQLGRRAGGGRSVGGTSPVSIRAKRPPRQPTETWPHSIGVWSCVSQHPSTTAPLVRLGTGTVDEAWKTRWRWSRGRKTRQRRPALGRGGRTGRRAMAVSVFHGLSTGAIPRNSEVAVGRRWETRGGVVGKQHRRGTNAGPICPASIRNIIRLELGRCAGGCDGEVAGREHRPIQSGAGLRFPPFDHRASGLSGDRRRGRSVENCQWQLKTAHFCQLKTAHFPERRPSGFDGVRTTGTACARCTERA